MELANWSQVNPRYAEPDEKREDRIYGSVELSKGEVIEQS